MSEAEVKPENQEPSRAEGAADGATEGAAQAQAGEQPPDETVRAEIEQAQAEAAKLKDQLLRTAADFDNFRKRSRREQEEAHRKGLERALLEILPVSDNLERAVEAASQSNDVASILEGVKMVLRLLQDSLERLGVERVSSEGASFDPSVHEAVQQVESDAPAGTVIHEMLPGYKLGGKLLRAAMVTVARPRPPTSPEAEATNNGAPEGEKA